MESPDPFVTAPGKKTSEFYATTIGAALTSILAVIALFTPGFSLDPGTQQAIVTTLAGGITLGTSLYGLGRAKVKSEHAKAVATIAASQSPPVINNVEKVENLQAANGVGPLQPPPHGMN